MAAITNQIIPSGGFNNVGVDFISPYTASQDIAVVDDKTGTNNVCKFDVTNLAILVDQIDELTAAAGVTIDSVLVKDGGVRLTNDTYLSARNNAGSADVDILKLNTSDGITLGDQAAWLTALGITVGAQTPTLDQGLQDIAALTPTANHFIVGDGTNWTQENATNAKISLGLGTLADQSTIDDSDFSGTVFAVTSGGTGSATAGGALTNLGAAASGANGDITSLTNCNLLEDGTAMAIGTTAAADVSLKYNSLVYLKLTSSNDVTPDSPGGTNLGNATDYFNGFHVQRINFAGTQGASTKDPTTDAPADWAQVQIGGTDYYLPAYAAS